MTQDGMNNIRQKHITKIHQRLDEILQHLWTVAAAVEDIAIFETDEHLGIEEAMRLDYQPVEDPHAWGWPNSTAWFRIRLTVPEKLAGRHVAVQFDSGGEDLLYHDYQPVQGLGYLRREYTLAENARGGETFELYVESWSGQWHHGLKQPVMHRPHLVTFNPELWDAYIWARALGELIPTHFNRGLAGVPVRVGLEEDPRRSKIIHGLSKALDRFDYQDTSPEGLAASAGRLKEALAPLIDRPAHASASTIACMGHAHLDVAWLWPLAESKRKCLRTFANQLGLMDRYDEYVYCQPQPQLYEYARQKAPDLYQRVREKVKTGQWVPTGCFWVESDCNMPSGESLVRQGLFGMRFFAEEFGVEPCCLWLPDVFGYSAALPGILRGLGIENFLTQKISWNEFTRFPYHSFWWEGIDGSRVLSHFPPIDTYNARCHGAELRMAQAVYNEKDRCDVQVMPFGFGDGGGGPTALMIEQIRRFGDLEGSPRLTPMTPRDFFDRLHAQSDDLPVWVGELYLQMHRATLTTQARTKRHNRKCELLLRDAEMLSAFAAVAGVADYPRSTFQNAWKIVLLNQFHDILPGSSITPVYEDTERDYANVYQAVAPARQSALQALAARADTSGQGQAVVVFNTLSWDRRDTVELDGWEATPPVVAVGPDGQAEPVHVGDDGGARFCAHVPALGFAVYHLRNAAGQTPPAITAETERLENEHLRLTFDSDGRLVSVFDKAADREVLAVGGTGNRLTLYEDKPLRFDAWDVEIFHTDNPLVVDGELISAEVVEAGPVRGVLRFVRRISRSAVRQDVILAAGARRAEFRTSVDWGDEKNVFLKVGFDLAVRAEQAKYEIQFGHVSRPTHRNTPSDFARFEVAGQKWADLAEGDYGVALLNDCKYGHSTRGSTMELSLLRAPKHPDPVADVNQTHEMTWALQPHATADVTPAVRGGAELNSPLLAVAADAHAGPAGPSGSYLRVNETSAVVEAVKLAEDDDGLVVRLYESANRRTRAVLATDLPRPHAEVTDLLERPLRPAEREDAGWAVDLTPFQLTTVKLQAESK